jgi:hypothetical protein
MKLSTRASTATVKNMAKANFCGRTTAAMRDNLLRTTYTVLVSMCGRTEEHMRENGNSTKWMERECSHGLMAGGMRDSTKMTRRKAMESSPSEMEEYIRVNGRTANSTVRVYSERKTWYGKVSGNRASVSNG